MNNIKKQIEEKKKQGAGSGSGFLKGIMLVAMLIVLVDWYTGRQTGGSALLPDWTILIVPTVVLILIFKK